eukprot:snap_masked-scaffold_26-processed-gene-2.45-mRNA-1 protein AED:1.00 eAED:1.00 QI:0/-1/0/0/-1/1/1/0/553
MTRSGKVSVQLLSIFGLGAAGRFSQEEFDAHCFELINNDSLNWRDGVFETDQEIVTCLRESLGDPIGFGEGTTGGYDPEGSSELTIITKDFPEQQIVNAIENPNYNWIVFDKVDFAEEVMLSMHRMNCTNPLILANLGNSSVEECMDPFLWCENNVVDSEDCINQFYNRGLNVYFQFTNFMIDTNTAIDGRGSKAYFMFNGFKVGMDLLEKGNVIITNILFRGAGHVEDHDMDPDMLRVTGGSGRVWIHQNTFEESGDAAVDIKRGAHSTTVSFNKFVNIFRVSLHGSNDAREINEMITSTYHNNLFLTTDSNFSKIMYTYLRRVPLLRRGQSHSFNNVFYNYVSDIASIRVGGRLLFENSIVLNQQILIDFKNRTLDWYANISNMFNFREGGLEVVDSFVSLVDENCNPAGVALGLNGSIGSTPDMLSQYRNYSRDMYYEYLREADGDLVKYAKQTAGKGGLTPYMSPYALDTEFIIRSESGSCLETVAQDTDEDNELEVVELGVVFVVALLVTAVIYVTTRRNTVEQEVVEIKHVDKAGEVMVKGERTVST